MYLRTFGVFKCSGKGAVLPSEQHMQWGPGLSLEIWKSAGMQNPAYCSGSKVRVRVSQKAWAGLVHQSPAGLILHEG